MDGVKWQHFTSLEEALKSLFGNDAYAAAKLISVIFMLHGLNLVRKYIIINE